MHPHSLMCYNVANYMSDIGINLKHCILLMYVRKLIKLHEINFIFSSYIFGVEKESHVFKFILLLI